MARNRVSRVGNFLRIPWWCWHISSAVLISIPARQIFPKTFGRSLPYKFLSAQVQSALQDQRDASEIIASEFFETFLHWGRNANYYMKNWISCVFGMEMSSIKKKLDLHDPAQKTFNKRHASAGNVYIVAWQELLAFLRETAQYGST